MISLEELQVDISRSIELVIKKRYASIAEAGRELELTRANIYRLFDNDPRSTLDQRLNVIFRLGGYFYIEEKRYNNTETLKIKLIDQLNEFKEKGSHTSNELLRMANMKELTKDSFNKILKYTEGERKVKLQTVLQVYLGIFPRKKIKFEV